ncbi:MAG: phosphoenolpyruvate-utilizing protein [Deltaproteobacteria bacterium]|nr:phosphoenolpyruvate-utilizing protein [Deltaproteobacteria bacterium]
MKTYDVVPGLEFDEKVDLEKSPAWFLDATHSVPPWTPMFGWFWVNFCRHGMQYGAEKLSLPTVKGWDWRFKDGGGYLTLILVTDEKERKEREVKFKRAIRPFIDDYDKLWGGYVNEMLDHYGRLKSCDIDTAGNGELLANFEDTINVCRRMWEIHMYMMYGVYTGFILFENTCKDTLGIDDTHPTFHDLLRGFDNKVFEVDRELWRFSKKAGEMGIADIILNSKSEDVLSELGRNDAGSKWLEELQVLLDEDGWRMQRMAEINLPTWVEDPTSAIASVKFFLKQGGDFDLDAEREKQVQKRDEATKEVLAKVPEDQKGWFTTLLGLAQKTGIFSEEHNHYLDLYTHALMRRSCLGIGKRLAKADVIDDPEDIFFLIPDEVRASTLVPDGFNLRHIVDKRREDWKGWCKKENPPAILKEGFTMDEAMGVLVQSNDPIALKVVVGSMPVPKPELNADLYGICGSGGTSEGIARVVMEETQLDEIQEGEILVAVSTSPSWTPIFGLLNGVVVDRGASLSHSAIVSREYGIPCVINVFEGTAKIKTGQRIKVDGDNGVVYILDK